jgi:hemoglobin
MTNTTMTTPYEVMGGESAILNLVDRFYFFMDTLPEAEDVRKMHAPDLSVAKAKLFKFFSGWLGGPDLFVQEYGHPMLRKRHFPFAIGQAERDQWVLCMNKAMAELALDADLRDHLLQALEQLATHMINQPN